LMAALAKLKVSTWPHSGPMALIERDEFGMREDFHLLDHWRYLGTVQHEDGLYDLLNNRSEIGFDPEIYRIVTRFLKAGKIRLLPLHNAAPGNQLL